MYVCMYIYMSYIYIIYIYIHLSLSLSLSLYIYIYVYILYTYMYICCNHMYISLSVSALSSANTHTHTHTHTLEHYLYQHVAHVYIYIVCTGRTLPPRFSLLTISPFHFPFFSFSLNVMKYDKRVWNNDGGKNRYLHCCRQKRRSTSPPTSIHPQPTPACLLPSFLAMAARYNTCFESTGNNRLLHF